MIQILFAILFWLTFLGCLSKKIRNQIFNIFNLEKSNDENHLKGLDGLRGISALWVALFHMWQWPQPALNFLTDNFGIITLGNKAVPIFVALSGLLTFRSLEKVTYKNVDLRISLMQFFINRFYRIYPLYFFTTLLSLVIFFGNYFYNNKFNIQIFIDRLFGEVFMLRIIGWQGMVNPPTWSLYVEVSFYIVAPLIFLLIKKQKILFSISAFLILNFSEINCIREYSLWKYFALGIIASEVLKNKLVNRNLSSYLAFAALGIFLLDVYTQLNSDLINIKNCPIEYTNLLSLSILIFLISIPNAKPLNIFLESAPFKFLGTISYSLYLTHSLIISNIFNISFNGNGGLIKLSSGDLELDFIYVFALIIPALISSASISYLIFEKPFLKFKSNI